MQSRLLFLLLNAILMLSFVACSTGEDLTNDPNWVPPTASLSSDLTALSLIIDANATVTITAKDVAGVVENFTVVSQDTDICDVVVTTTDISDANTSDANATQVFITDPIVSVLAKAIGTTTLLVTSQSGNEINVSVVVVGPPTLTLDSETITLDVASTQNITATATTDGTTQDSITATSSDISVASVTVSNSTIIVTGVKGGEADISVVSGSGITATTHVIVNEEVVDPIVVIEEDPNEYTNHTYTDSVSLVYDNTISDIVAIKDDWYVFDTVIGFDYEVSVKKLIDDGGIEAHFFTDPNETEDFSILVSSIYKQESVTHKFTASANRYYVKINNYEDTDTIKNLESVGYELRVVEVPVINTTTLSTADDYIKGIVTDDNGTSYTLSVQYGKLYEIWVYDKNAQLSTEYTLDIVVSAYGVDNNITYFSKANTYYEQYEIINPTTDQDITIHIEPLNSGNSGTYAIKVVEKESLSDGMTVAPLVLNDGIAHSGKIGVTTNVSKWSYYSTDALASVTKTVLISNISPSEDLKIEIYEDSNCEAVVSSTNSGISGTASITRKYSQTGQFCIGIENRSAINSAVYDIKVSGEKEEGINTYPSTQEELIPDNEIDILSSKIEIKYGSLSINKITVNLNITHTYDDDLLISLVSPSGTEVVLSANRGGVGDNYINTVFDDSASISISDVLNAVAPFTDSYTPETPLSAFNAEPADGIWSLNIEDRNDGNAGTLDSWSITVE